MKVRVRYFAFLQDITKKSEEQVETNCATVDCLISELGKVYGKKFEDIVRNGINGIQIIVLVNGRSNVKELQDNAEVAFLPPAAGGNGELLKKGTVDFYEEIRRFRQEAPPDAGAMGVYIGFVKGMVDGHRVYELKYQAYEEYTLKRFQEIEESLKQKYKNLAKIKILHIIDDMKPGEDVILIMAIGKSRHDVLQSIEEAIELVKNTTGIWKLEVRDDGEFWVVAGNKRVKRE